MKKYKILWVDDEIEMLRPHILFLNEKGYKVVYISQEPMDRGWHDSKLGGTLQNVIDKSGDFPLSDRFADLCHADYFIGVGSGLSWLAWASGVRTMMISGFSKPFTEFEDDTNLYQKFSPKTEQKLDNRRLFLDDC